VLEGGEVTRGAMLEARTSYSLATFARIFGLSRQAMINDDLGAFSELAVRYGRAAAEFEAGQLAALLIANPTMYDSVALFNAAHGNQAAAPTVISTTSLGVALSAMRRQTGLDAATPIDVTPRYLVVPAALEVIALQNVTAITPAATTNVNPFSGKLEVIVDPRLDVNSATIWYLAADSMSIDTLEYAYLDGAEGVQLESKIGFDVEGIEMKARLDFGAAALDWRGLYRNS